MFQVPMEVALAHRVLNLILVKVRWLVGEETNYKLLYDILDRIEILPTLLEEPARVQEFVEHVEALAEKYPAFQLAADEIRRQKLISAAR